MSNQNILLNMVIMLRKIYLQDKIMFEILLLAMQKQKISTRKIASILKLNRGKIWRKICKIKRHYPELSSIFRGGRK